MSVCETKGGDVCTKAFRTGAARWALSVVADHRGSLWSLGVTAAAFLGAVVAALATGDLRWGIVGLMVVFLVLPMVMAMLLIAYGMLPVSSLNVSLHRVRFLPDGNVEVDVLRRKREEEEDEKEGGKEGQDSDSAGEAETVRRVMLKAERLGRPRLTASGFRVPVREGNRNCWLDVPAGAFGSSEEFRRAFGMTGVRK